jgi:hypothetical protein
MFRENNGTTGVSELGQLNRIEEEDFRKRYCGFMIRSVCLREETQWITGNVMSGAAERMVENYSVSLSRSLGKCVYCII